MTLETAPIGANVVVAALASTPERRLRWAQMGIRPGAVVEVQSRTSGGGRILGIGRCRVAVDHAVLTAVAVEPVA